MYMEKLANGINPIDDAAVPDEDVVNNVRLSRCFFFVADVLRQVIDNGGITKQIHGKKQPFDLPVAQRSAFHFSVEPITVSKFTQRINELIPTDTMVNLTTTMLTEWLLAIDLMKTEVNAEGKTTKRPTEQGVGLGICLENRTGMNGQYTVVVYNIDAQHFVLDNLDAVVAHARSKKENQGQPWSIEHDRHLRDLYQRNVPIKEIAIALKRNVGAIRARLKKLGITE